MKKQKDIDEQLLHIASIANARTHARTHAHAHMDVLTSDKLRAAESAETHSSMRSDNFEQPRWQQRHTAA